MMSLLSYPVTKKGRTMQYFLLTLWRTKTDSMITVICEAESMADAINRHDEVFHGFDGWELLIRPMCRHELNSYERI